MIEPRMTYFQNSTMSHGNVPASYPTARHYHREQFNGMLL